MSANMKKLIYLMLGIAAGLVALGLQEIILTWFEGSYLLMNLLHGITVGLAFGLFFGSVEGIAINEGSKLLHSGIFGVAFGIVGGGLAFLGAGWILGFISNTMNLSFNDTYNLALPLSRIISWSIIGILIGSAEGIRSVSLKRTMIGVFGGLLGGMLGGLVLELGLFYLGSPFLGRLVGFVLMGIFLGFFLGDFEVRFSYGRLRVLRGALKNKEFILSKAHILIGSDLSSDVYVTKYRKLGRAHAGISKSSGTIQLVNRIPDHAILVNDEIIQGPVNLKYEDVIQIGDLKMLLLPV